MAASCSNRIEVNNTKIVYGLILMVWCILYLQQHFFENCTVFSKENGFQYSTMKSHEMFAFIVLHDIIEYSVN